MNYFERTYLIQSLGFPLFLCGVLAACGPRQGASAPETEFETLDDHELRTNFQIEKNPTKLVYRYNSAKNLCESASGIPGRNLGFIAECGELKWVLAKNLNLSGMRLNGLYVENSNFSGANFSSAHLIGAQFKKVVLNNALFINARLENIRLAEIRGDYFRLGPQALKGATISPDSVFPFIVSRPELFSFDSLAGQGAVLKGVRSLKKDSSFQNIELDDQLSKVERQILQHDLDRLASLKMIAPRGSMYQQAFGGSDELSLAEYVLKRVRRIEDVQEKSNSMVARNYSVLMFLDRYESRLSALILRNLSTALRYQEALGQASKESVEELIAKVRRELPEFKPVPWFNGRAVEVLHPSVGTVTMGTVYFSTQLNTMTRIGNLVHEARHSDCTEKAPGDARYSARLQKRLSLLLGDSRSLDDAQERINSRGMLLPWELKLLGNRIIQIRTHAEELVDEVKGLRAELEKFPTCGHRHRACPMNHPDKALRGMAGACDDLSWGAYAVGAAFFEGVVSHCQNCSESERQTAMMGHLDSLNRIIDLSRQRADVREGIDEETFFKPLVGLTP